jgi:hypothetical protein
MIFQTANLTPPLNPTLKVEIIEMANTYKTLVRKLEKKRLRWIHKNLLTYSMEQSPS